MHRHHSRRFILLVLAVVIGVLLGRCFRPHSARPPTTPPPPVAIEDGKTIDFSSGQPVVQDDTAALEQARREMEAATANITFAPTKPPAPPAQDTPATTSLPPPEPAP